MTTSRARRPGRQRWNPNKIVAAIRLRAARGLCIQSKYVNSRINRLYGAALYYFGSWGEALKAAGLEAPRLHTRWSREEMISVLQSIHRDHGDTLKDTLNKFARRNGAGISNALRYEFGSLQAARKAAGVPPPIPKRSRVWSPEKVIAELQAESKKGLIRYGRLLAHRPSLLTAATKHFGRWSLAVEAAGVTTSWRHNHSGHSMKWTKENVLGVLREAARKGKVRINPLRRKYAGIYIAARREFGSWWKAVSAAGIASSDPHLSPE